MSDDKSNGNQSLSRGLRLLEILSNYPNGCPLAKLSEIAQLNKSTVHRLLQGLQSEGYVQPTATAGNYRLTTKCLSIGQKILMSLNIINIAAPYLEALNLTLGETVNFSKRENDYAIMIYKLEPTTGMLRTQAYIGQRLPLYCSAMGKLYLAYEKNKDYLPHYWQSQAENIKPLTANTVTHLPLMEKELNDIRQEQFAMDREENEIGVVCVACPIFNYQGNVDYAVSVSMSSYKLKQLGIPYLLNEIQKTALLISQELGYKPDHALPQPKKQ
ncbi:MULTISPECIES: IclR family transcriptional regulator [unclassified Avibacterium]|uniref:IclR family transcriptional regulator n=1 Tax=unclassified Avibacterium TaxID=2685287 RepID=UPI00202711A8|nr:MULTISPECIES: IclR family transcriptional regulator [unclassified Avibacterium]URL01922.1 IclR family transcriptional regulator [Avibacterium sp. 20-126]MCW9699050.1 IclR family transcriptional regulator [Avibacterium sp. 20-129]MCW9717474.1 IclR family transcriptional regulator [Avibacterium sp. 21-599]MCW9733069.1 IclR family transcriptional regulator [Avibacterium sp. 20-15]URL05197.1 IclR family transcriptional regulator [Avibacterium sp. 20-132]